MNYLNIQLNQTRKTLLKQSLPFLVVMFSCIAYFIYHAIYDIFYEGSFGTAHFTFELIAFAGLSIALVAGVLYALRILVRLNGQEQRNHAFTQNLIQILNQQMDERKMTPTEQEIAWLIIRGHQFSEIAKLRGVKESTTRLQATSIYSKAGVNSRSEFMGEIFNTILMLNGADTTKSNQPRISRRLLRQ